MVGGFNPRWVRRYYVWNYAFWVRICRVGWDLAQGDWISLTDEVWSEKEKEKEKAWWWDDVSRRRSRWVEDSSPWKVDYVRKETRCGFPVALPVISLAVFREAVVTWLCRETRVPHRWGLQHVERIKHFDTWTELSRVGLDLYQLGLWAGFIVGENRDNGMGFSLIWSFLVVALWVFVLWVFLLGFGPWIKFLDGKKKKVESCLNLIHCCREALNN